MGNSSGKRPPPGLTPGIVAPPQPPYFGPRCEYWMEKFLIPFQMQMGLHYLPNPQMQFSTLNTDLYVPRLISLYEAGYRLLTFSVTPGNMSTSGFLSVNIQQTFSCQGIFRRVPPEESQRRYSLKVSKSTLPFQIFSYGFFRIGQPGSAGSMDHIFQTISQETAAGARLVAIEITGGNGQNMPIMNADPFRHNRHHGHGRHHHGGLGMFMYGYNPSMILGVDVFLEVPLFPNAPRYTYQCVPLPMTAVVSAGFTGYTWSLQMDWVGLMTQYLGCGWKLVEVFMDQNSNIFSNSALFSTSFTVNLNCVFFFEKEEAKLHDNTPEYEATMIEFNVVGHVQAGFGQSSVTYNADWDGVIGKMGESGWELATILETPAQEQGNRGFTSVELYKRVWMFFQRKIINAPAAVEPPFPGAEKPPIGFNPQ